MPHAATGTKGSIALAVSVLCISVFLSATLAGSTLLAPGATILPAAPGEESTQDGLAVQRSPSLYQDELTRRQREKHLVNPADFEGNIDGVPVHLYTLTNRNGVSIDITNFGGKIISIFVPDRNGNFADVVLAYPTLAMNQTGADPWFGGIIGRYANVIRDSKIKLDGTTYNLTPSWTFDDGAGTVIPYSLHGGLKGFSTVPWNVTSYSKEALVLRYFSKDGSEGFPGNMQVVVTYALDDNDQLSIQYYAISDKKTVLSMTNHAYFNLAGHNAGKDVLLNHQVKINAQSFVELSYGFAPTGKLAKVTSVPAYDFRSFKSIGAGLANEANVPQLQYAWGFDNCMVLDGYDGHNVRKVLTTYEPTSGRQMDVYTDQPGIQFYTGNGLDPNLYPGKAGAAYGYRSGMALETEHYPDSPNHPNFPTTVLNAGQIYHSTTVYKFSVRGQEDRQ